MMSYKLHETEKVNSNVNINKKTEELFKIANKCWAGVPIPIIRGMGTKIEQINNGNETEVIAKWYTLFGGETDPFFKFKIKSYGENIQISFIERENYFFFKDDYKQDAYRWSSGDYTCS